MRSTIFLFIMTFSFVSALAQKKVFDSKGNDIEYAIERTSLTFSETTHMFPYSDQPQKAGQESGPASAIIASIPTIVDVAFKIGTKFLSNRLKKFSGEYIKSQSYLDPLSRVFPRFTFERTISGADIETSSTALKVDFAIEPIKENLVPRRGRDTLRAIVIYVKDILLQYSKAKVKAGDNLDYTFEIKLTYYSIDKGEKITQELKPLSVPSIAFSGEGAVEASFDVDDFRSEIIFLPNNFILTEVDLKVIETNPRKIRAEEILEVWNENQDNVKTIVKEFLPSEESGDDEEDNENAVVEPADNEDQHDEVRN